MAMSFGELLTALRKVYPPLSPADRRLAEEIARTQQGLDLPQVLAELARHRRAATAAPAAPPVKEASTAPRRVAIVGSRDYPDPDQVRAYVEQLPEGTVVVTGGARGVDKVAEEAARARGLPVEVLPADWERYGRSAGMRRNYEVLQRADEVAAFWNGESPGTQHMIELAQSSGRPLQIFQPPQSPVHGGLEGASPVRGSPERATPAAAPATSAEPRQAARAQAPTTGAGLAALRQKWLQYEQDALLDMLAQGVPREQALRELQSWRQAIRDPLPIPQLAEGDKDWLRQPGGFMIKIYRRVHPLLHPESYQPSQKAAAQAAPAAPAPSRPTLRELEQQDIRGQAVRALHPEVLDALRQTLPQDPALLTGLRELPDAAALGFQDAALGVSPSPVAGLDVVTDLDRQLAQAAEATAPGIRPPIRRAPPPDPYGSLREAYAASLEARADQLAQEAQTLRPDLPRSGGLPQDRGYTYTPAARLWRQATELRQYADRIRAREAEPPPPPLVDAPVPEAGRVQYIPTPGQVALLARQAEQLERKAQELPLFKSDTPQRLVDVRGETFELPLERRSPREREELLRQAQAKWTEVAQAEELLAEGAPHTDPYYLPEELRQLDQGYTVPTREFLTPSERLGVESRDLSAGVEVPESLDEYASPQAKLQRFFALARRAQDFHRGNAPRQEALLRLQAEVAARLAGAQEWFRQQPPRGRAKVLNQYQRLLETIADDATRRLIPLAERSRVSPQGEILARELPPMYPWGTGRPLSQPLPPPRVLDPAEQAHPQAVTALEQQLGSPAATAQKRRRELAALREIDELINEAAQLGELPRTPQGRYRRASTVLGRWQAAMEDAKLQGPSDYYKALQTAKSQGLAQEALQDQELFLDGFYRLSDDDVMYILRLQIAADRGMKLNAAERQLLALYNQVADLA